MKKILFISNIADEKISDFARASIYAAKELNMSFHSAANWDKSGEEGRHHEEETYGIKIHHLPIVRNPFSPKNIKVYWELKKIIQRESFNIIHCNTPVGGVLGRFLGSGLKKTKIIYTAHGLHFYKGAPLHNIIFKWAEMIMATFTDVIITMNKEDYLAAQKLKLKEKGKVFYVPGVGIDTKSFIEAEENRRKLRGKLRKELGLKEEDIVFISMGDLIKRKNYKTSLKAISKANNSKIHYIICGRGPELKKLQKISERLGIEEQVHFLGFIEDIRGLLKAADVFLFTSYQEGLPRSMMEAMASGLPCIASKIRGNVDLIRDGEGGYLINCEDIEGFAKAINTLAEDENKRKSMGRNNIKTIEKFDFEIVKKELSRIYSEVMEADI